MNECLEEITKAIEWFKKNKNDDPVLLLEALRKITANLYTLETYRAEYHNKYEQKVFEAVKSGESVARGQNNANLQVPELYMLRRIMEAAYETVGAIRTIISFKKLEWENKNN